MVRIQWKISMRRGVWGHEIRPSPRWKKVGKFSKEWGFGAVNTIAFVRTHLKSSTGREVWVQEISPPVETGRLILTKSGMWGSEKPPPVRTHWKISTRRGVLWARKSPPWWKMVWRFSKEYLGSGALKYSPTRGVTLAYLRPSSLEGCIKNTVGKKQPFFFAS